MLFRIRMKTPMTTRLFLLCAILGAAHPCGFAAPPPLPAPPITTSSKTEEPASPRRAPRDVTPWRTLLNGPAVRVGQVLVPERVFPEDRPVFSDKPEPAFIRLAGNEYESLQLLAEVPEGADPFALELTVSELTNEKGAVLPPPVVREALYLMPPDTPGTALSGATAQWPEPLFEPGWHTRLSESNIATRNVAIVRTFRKRLFWLNFHAPPIVKPGLFTGRIRLSLAGQPAGEIPVEVRVHAFALPRQSSFIRRTGPAGGNDRTLPLRTFLADPATDPILIRAWFWQALVSGKDGRKSGSPEPSPDGLVYPDPAGSAPSIRLETLRDGVEDYDYLTLLRLVAQAARARHLSAPALEVAEALLSDPKLGDRVKTAESLHGLRGRIAELIETLDRL